MKKSLKVIGFTLTAFFLMVIIIASVVAYANKYVTETRQHFFCQDIQRGMSKEDVKKVIDRFGNYTWQDDNVIGLSYVYLKQFVAMNALGSPIVMRFDSNNKLLAIGSRYKAGDEMQIKCDGK